MTGDFFMFIFEQIEIIHNPAEAFSEGEYVQILSNKRQVNKNMKQNTLKRR